MRHRLAIAGVSVADVDSAALDDARSRSRTVRSPSAAGGVRRHQAQRQRHPVTISGSAAQINAALAACAIAAIPTSTAPTR
jgi:hypothetical protein